MSATDELRRLLDERGVEWWEGDASHTTEWTNGRGQDCSAMYWNPTLNVLVSGLTPEQAIAMTLGTTTFDADLERALSFMRIWISDDAHLGESDISYALERAEGLRNLDAVEQAIAATLGGGENRISERLRGIASDMRNIGASSMTPHELFAYWAREVDKAADLAETLGCGKLTVEQVREAIERHFGKVAVLDDGKPVEWRDDWVCKVAIDYKGIADELNAMLGGR